MPADSDDAANALEIMREWNWRYCDPDGVPFTPGKSLHTMVNRLAVEGIRRPQDAILQLLCQGDLLAQGSYRWQKFQDLEHYQREVGSEIIATRHWRKLAELIESAKVGDQGCSIETTYQLTELGLRDCLAYVWDYQRDGFSYTMFVDASATWDDDYLEEWFSAWEIEAWPKFLDEADALEFNADSAAPDTSKPKQVRGRSAAKWWPDFAEELALTVYMEGIPEGSGHEGQSGLLDKVLARLSTAGKPEPSRTTVQPVINAVLTRIRSAGK